MLIDSKYNLNTPWSQNKAQEKAKGIFTLYSHGEGRDQNTIPQYIPLILEELRKLSSSVEELSEKINKMQKHNIDDSYIRSNSATVIPNISKGNDSNSNISKRNKSNFKEKFMSNTTFMTRPTAAMVYVGDGIIPKMNPNMCDSVNYTVDPSKAVDPEPDKLEAADEAVEMKEVENEILKEIPVESTVEEAAAENEPKPETIIDNNNNSSIKSITQKLGDIFK